MSDPSLSYDVYIRKLNLLSYPFNIPTSWVSKNVLLYHNERPTPVKLLITSSELTKPINSDNIYNRKV